ncbi:hypothetical protein GXW82_07245 [Streptacidiphilus sp. 4-A2]|nr:hypothetical protein [Streptacidiphilus sp. 4-A2]
MALSTTRWNSSGLRTPATSSSSWEASRPGAMSTSGSPALVTGSAPR